MSELLKFINSQKGKKLLIVENSSYSFHNYNKDRINWRCTQYNKSHCPGKIVTNTDKKTGKCNRNKNKRLKLSAEK